MPQDTRFSVPLIPIHKSEHSATKRLNNIACNTLEQKIVRLWPLLVHFTLAKRSKPTPAPTLREGVNVFFSRLEEIEEAKPMYLQVSQMLQNSLVF